MFIVRGGEFTDTSFTKLRGEEERYGPYSTYEAARDQWKNAVWWQVDVCTHRLFIERLS